MLPFISGLSEIDKKLIYIHSMKPILNKTLLYSDGTEWYVNPAEPEKDSDVTIRFRTGIANVDEVIFCDYESERKMTCVESTHDFDFYEITVHVTDKKLRYYFKINSMLLGETAKVSVISTTMIVLFAISQYFIYYFAEADKIFETAKSKEYMSRDESAQIYRLGE